jgi:hypothetical protein
MADNLLNRNGLRLLRETWRTPSALAQELFMITSDENVAERPVAPQLAERLKKAATNAPREQRPSSSQSAITPRPQPSIGDQVRAAQQQLPAIQQLLPVRSRANTVPGVPVMPTPILGLPSPRGTPSRSHAAEAIHSNQRSDRVATAGLSLLPAAATDTGYEQTRRAAVAAQAPAPARSGVTAESRPAEPTKARRSIQRDTLPTIAPVGVVPESQTARDGPGYSVVHDDRDSHVLASGAALAGPTVSRRSQSDHSAERATSPQARSPDQISRDRVGLPPIASPPSAPASRNDPVVRIANPLPSPAHTAFDVPATDRDAYAPLGVPGAYSGMERLAADHLPHDYPTIERDNSDPFAKKYYDLRFYPTDTDSPRPGGGGGTSTYIGQLTDDSDGVTCTVQLYPSGQSGSPGQTVTVTILQLADGENVPNGTWLTGIQSTSGGYYAQVPIWLA